MPDFYQEGNRALATDKPQNSLQKINDLLTKPPVPGFAIPAFDTIVPTYYGSTNNPHVVTYSLNGVIVATLTLTYVGGTPVANDALLASAGKS